MTLIFWSTNELRPTVWKTWLGLSVFCEINLLLAAPFYVLGRSDCENKTSQGVQVGRTRSEPPQSGSRRPVPWRQGAAVAARHTAGHKRELWGSHSRGGTIFLGIDSKLRNNTGLEQSGTASNGATKVTDRVPSSWCSRKRTLMTSFPPSHQTLGSGQNGLL